MFHTIKRIWINMQILRNKENIEFAGDHNSQSLRGKIWFELLTQCIISLVITLTALYVILNDRSDGKQREWAFGAIGVVLGYWMR
jgi:hypothetical protein